MSKNSLLKQVSATDVVSVSQDVSWSLYKQEHNCEDSEEPRERGGSKVQFPGSWSKGAGFIKWKWLLKCRGQKESWIHDIPTCSLTTWWPKKQRSSCFGKVSIVWRSLSFCMCRRVWVFVQIPTFCFFFLYFFSSQGAVFLEGISVKGVTQITTQPKLGEVQRMCQQMAEWEK